MKKKRFYHTLFFLYGALMLWLLFDRGGAEDGLPYWDQVRMNLNLVPLRTVSNYLDVLLRREYYLEKWGFASIYAYQARHAVINLVGNVIMFIPLGYLLPKVSARQRKLWRTLLTTALLIALVELLQLFSLRGSCDVDDVILNVMGAAIGYGAYKIFPKK